MRTKITSGIYCIENKSNGKKYIGQSRCIEDRWCKHKNELNKGNHDNDYLQKSWNKYGEDGFSFYILEECSIDMLDEREIYYIEHYDTINRDKGYNLKTGGQVGNTHTEEARKKLSESIKKSYTDELRERRRQDALRQWANPEIKAKIMGENNGMYGKHHSEEAKRKIGEATRNKAPSRKVTTKVLCVETNIIYDSASAAAKALSLDSSSILRVCRGERKTRGGFHWEFVM